MTDDVELLISTKSLKRILDENPKVRLKLHKLAHEKIAEEIKRKLSNDGKELAKRLVKDAIDEAYEDLKSYHRFPKEARERVQDIAKSTATSVVSRGEDRVNAEFNRLLKQHIDNALTTLTLAVENAEKDFKKRMVENMHTLAREAFFEVLKEARGEK